jgi:hypothetical protein
MKRPKEKRGKKITRPAPIMVTFALKFIKLSTLTSLSVLFYTEHKKKTARWRKNIFYVQECIYKHCVIGYGSFP